MEGASSRAPHRVSYTVRLLANAQRDLADIEAYHDEHVPHETDRCLDAIEAALDWIADYAHQSTVSRFGLRHVSTETFRYYVWYRLFGQERFVQVVAVLHHRRGDDALAERVP
ncbi:type II toxin-antitoxin system RelE/ParE family toxin [Galbitalea sp. SE-J8]|uniref:type II toxin-antitoxin system RelE/ParE family toxin n=1 Tax=Galbitalea sp. SE-J8 TaxID=3054952 RepID=UPI00259D29A7|nr:type II toxin-antitoxin system RelE/ParE family toxin [Galbitalea sp. SE-J8]MDM4763664.1 type II toxin-antitoxin system RelE/ParE family toxin [Galbitalea sp. SE-J8]